MTTSDQAETVEGEFLDIDTDIVVGACIDGDGRIWLNIDASDHSPDCLSCDYCGIETAKGMLCIDSKESACLRCFGTNYAR